MYIQSFSLSDCSFNDECMTDSLFVSAHQSAVNLFTVGTPHADALIRISSEDHQLTIWEFCIQRGLVSSPVANAPSESHVEESEVAEAQAESPPSPASPIVEQDNRSLTGRRSRVAPTTAKPSGYQFFMKQPMTIEELTQWKERNEARATDPNINETHFVMKSNGMPELLQIRAFMWHYFTAEEKNVWKARAVERVAHEGTILS